MTKRPESCGSRQNIANGWITTTTTAARSAEEKKPVWTSMQAAMANRIAAKIVIFVCVFFLFAQLKTLLCFFYAVHRDTSHSETFVVLLDATQHHLCIWRISAGRRKRYQRPASFSWRPSGNRRPLLQQHCNNNNKTKMVCNALKCLKVAHINYNM